jgi:hypothetical protein
MLLNIKNMEIISTIDENASTKFIGVFSNGDILISQPTDLYLIKPTTGQVIKKIPTYDKKSDTQYYVVSILSSDGVIVQSGLMFDSVIEIWR